MSWRQRPGGAVLMLQGAGKRIAASDERKLATGYASWRYSCLKTRGGVGSGADARCDGQTRVSLSS